MILFADFTNSQHRLHELASRNDNVIVRRVRTLLGLMDFLGCADVAASASSSSSASDGQPCAGRAYRWQFAELGVFFSWGW